MAQKACREGYTALYLRLPKLFQALSLAHGDGRFPKLMAALEQQAVRFGTRIQSDDGQHPDVSNPDDGHSYKYHDCKAVDLSARSISGRVNN